MDDVEGWGNLLLDVPPELLESCIDWGRPRGQLRRMVLRDRCLGNYYVRKTIAWLQGRLPAPPQSPVYYRKLKRKLHRG